MSLRSGHGGYVKVNAVTVPNGRWSGNWRARNAEVTQSDSGGSTLYFPVVQDNEWEISLCRDDAAYPEVIGLVGGAIIAVMQFKLGAGLLCDKLTNTTVDEVSPVVDNANDVVRVTVRGRGGYLTPNQTIV